MSIIKNIVRKEKCLCCQSIESKKVTLGHVLYDIQAEINHDYRDNPQKCTDVKIEMLYRIIEGLARGESLDKIIMEIASFMCKSEYIIEEENDTTKQN